MATKKKIDGDLQKKYLELYAKRSEPEALNELLAFITKHEPLLKENPHKHTLFPIKFHDIFELYKKHQETYWTADEINYSLDKDEWNKLNDNTRKYIEYTLAFFAASDGIVMENISVNFSNEVQVQEVQIYYNFQNMIEGVHSETYSRLIDVFITDEKHKKKLFEAITTLPCVKQKMTWAKKWLDTNNLFAERVVAFSAVEGIFFSGSFCSIFWLKEQQLMTHALSISNDFISRDESLHCRAAIMVYNNLIFKLPTERIQEIFRSAVEVEIEFITESLPCKLIGMNSEKMIEYIKSVCDYRLEQYGVPKIYNIKNPFPFMEKLGLRDKGNFFEKTITEYKASSSMKKYEMNTNDLNNIDEEDF